MKRRVRKLALTAHITFSVGWLGSVAAFLVLSIAGITSQDAEVVRGVYLSMDLIGRLIIIPMSLTAIATGLVMALGTEWGLFRYYWVLVKFLLTIIATITLILHQFKAISVAAKRVLEHSQETLPDVGRLGIQLVTDAALALLVLLVIITLSVVKPWGRMRSGQLKQKQYAGATNSLPLGLKIFLVVIVLIVMGFVVVHFAGGGLGNHGH